MLKFVLVINFSQSLIFMNPTKRWKKDKVIKCLSSIKLSDSMLFNLQFFFLEQGTEKILLLAVNIKQENAIHFFWQNA